MAALNRWNPFDEISSLWPRDLFSRDLFGRVQPDGGLMVEWSPRCDVTETETEIIVHAELPGVDAKDMEVTMREGILTVKGEKRTGKEEKKNGGSYNERFFGSFQRSIAVPSTVDESKIDAKLKDGVLEVHLPKTKVTEPPVKKIEIKAN